MLSGRKRQIGDLVNIQRLTLTLAWILSAFVSAAAIPETLESHESEQRLLRRNREPGNYLDSRIMGGDEDLRVVGGEVAPTGRYPYMVELLDPSGEYISGASLIAPNLVLTAAHSTVINIDAVSIGRQDLSNANENYETIKVVEVVVNPNFRPRKFNHDAAILKLERASSYQHVKLNNSSDVPADNSELTVMGWGVDESGGISNILKQTQVTTMTNSECKATSYLDEEITDAMLCASGDGIRDACDGDSGGPLIIKGQDANSDVQVGIVSFGRGCASVDYPGVYTRISFILPWIQHTGCMLSPENCHILVTDCIDTSQFTTNSGETQTCDWVYRRSLLRCPTYGSQNCPLSCNMCDKLIDYPTLPVQP